MNTYATWKAKYLAAETTLDYQAWLEQEVARLLTMEKLLAECWLAVVEVGMRITANDLEAILNWQTPEAS